MSEEISLLLVVALGFALAVISVWLTVRIVNRREKWAKRTAWALGAALVLYPLSFGPVNWLAARDRIPEWLAQPIEIFYWPLVVAHAFSPGPVKKLLSWYIELWM